MEETDVGSSVIRQETFDVDPSLTKRSRSGGVKRGTIALPIIGSDSHSQTPPIKESSFEYTADALNEKKTVKSLNIKNGRKPRPSTYKLNEGEQIKNEERKDKTDTAIVISNKTDTQKSVSRGAENAIKRNESKVHENREEENKKKPVQNKPAKLDENRYELVDIPTDKNEKPGNIKKGSKDTSESKPPQTTAKKSDKLVNKSLADSKNNKQKEETKNDKLNDNRAQTDSRPKEEKHKKTKTSIPENKTISEKQPETVTSKKRPAEEVTSKQSPEKPKTDSTKTTDKKPSDENRRANVAKLDKDLGKEKQSESNRPLQSVSNKKGPTINKDVKPDSFPANSNTSQKNKPKIVVNLAGKSEAEFPFPKSKGNISDRKVEPNRPKKSDGPNENDEQKPKQVTFDVDAGEFEEDTISLDLLTFEASETNHHPPYSTVLNKDSVKNQEKSREETSRKDRESEKVEENAENITSTKSVKDDESVIKRDVPRDDNTDFKEENTHQSVSESVSEKSKLKRSKFDANRGESPATPRYRSVSSDRAPSNTGINPSVKGYSERGSRTPDTLSLGRNSLSPDKHYHGISQIYSPEKPHFETERRGRNSKMDPSPSQQYETLSYDSINAERQTLLDAEKTYKKRIKQLEEELNQFLRTIDDIRAENKILRSRIDDLEQKSTGDGEVSHQSKNTVVINTETAGLETQIEDLKREKKELSQVLQESQTKISLAISDNDRLTKDCETLKARNDELEAKCKELETNKQGKGETSPEEEQSELNQLQEENASLKTDLAKLKSEQERTVLDLQNAVEESGRLRQELSDLKKNDSGNKDDADKLQKELDASRKDEARAKAQFEKLKEEYDKTKEDGDEAKNKEIEKLKAEIVRLKMELKRIEAEKEKYKELTTPRPDDGEGKRTPSSETMALKSQVISLQTENQTLNEEVIKMKAEHLQTVKKMHDLEKAASSFEKSVTAVESQKLTEIQELKNENDKLKGQMKTLNENLAQKKSEIEELMTAMKDDKFDDEIKQAKEDKAQIAKDLELKSGEVEELRKEIEELKIQNDKLEKEKKSEDENIQSLQKLNKSRQTENEELRSKLDELTKELEQEKQTSASLSGKEKDVAEAKDQVSKLEKDIENMKIKHDKEKQDLKEKNEQENEEWRKKYISLDRENQEEIRKLKEEIEKLQGEIKKLESLRVAAKDLEDTRVELVVLQNRISELTIELEQKSQVEERNFEMSLKLDTSNKKVRELEQENKSLKVDQDNVGDFESSNKRLTEENKRLRQLLDGQSVDTKLEILERKQKDSETRVKQLEGWVGGLYEEKPDTYVSKLHQKKQAFSKAVPTVAEKKTSKKPRSLDEVHVKLEEDKRTHTSTPSLPNIFQPEKNQLTFGLGYSQIHKSRIKAHKYKKN